MRTLALLILAGWLALTVSAAEANFGLGGHGGPGAGTSQLISSVPLTGNSFTAGSSPGTVVGTIGTPVMSPSSPAFSGSCCTLSGTDAASFTVVGSNLETVGILCASSPPCTYHINLVATQGGISNSPFPQAATITANAQTIASVPLSNNTFTPGSGSGTVVGTIGTPVMSPTLPAFSGSCCTLSGTDAASFQIVGGNLETNGTPCPSGPCSFSINLVATQAGASNSPFPQPETITAGTTTNVISVQLSNENLPVSAATGTVVGALSAKVTGGGACSGCSFSMVNAGASSDGTIPITCSASSNAFQVAGTNLENLSVINTAQVYGQVADISPTGSYICVKATPPVGASFTQPFSIMIRNPTFTAFGPLFVQYTTGVGKSVPLSTTICWTHCGGSGATPTVTYTLGSDAACTAPGLSISGSNLVFSSSYTVPNAGSGGANCHITATAAGVATGMVGTGGSNFVADVHISQGAYVGPGDATYPNGATGLTWTNWTGPYAYSAAYATANGPAWLVQREGDQSLLTINALANGDMDFNTLASDCDTSICYIIMKFDQSGNSPSCSLSTPTTIANCMPTWGLSNDAGITTRHPIVYFDAFDGTRVSGTNSNSTDRFDWNCGLGTSGCQGTYNGSGTTGTLWIDAMQNSSTFGGSVIEMAATGTGSNPYIQLGFTNTPGANGGILYVGPNNHTGGSQINGAVANDSNVHSMIGVINGASSVFKVNGTETTGTLSTASFIKPLAFGGGYGGGSDQGLIPGPAAISSTVASTSQRQALCLFDQWTYGIAGTC